MIVMSNNIQPSRTRRKHLTTRKTLANCVRIFLIVLNCIYGLHLVAGFANTTTVSSPTPSGIKNFQHVPLVPITGQWNFDQESGRSHSNLIPLPQGARTICNRIGSDGSIQMEIIQLDTSRNQLLKGWRFSGWDVRSAPHRRPGDAAWFCKRGDEFVYAWSASKNDRIESLMLVNDPVQFANQTN
jgi:hypothetical protein